MTKDKLEWYSYAVRVRVKAKDEAAARLICHEVVDTVGEDFIDLVKANFLGRYKDE